MPHTARELVVSSLVAVARWMGQSLVLDGLI
jgi:hypothetical protein